MGHWREKKKRGGYATQARGLVFACPGSFLRPTSISRSFNREIVTVCRYAYHLDLRPSLKRAAKRAFDIQAPN